MTQNDLNRLHGRMDQILDAVQALERDASSRLTTLETYRKSCRIDVERMHEALFGNGKPGLVADVRQIQTVGAIRSKWFWLLATAVPAMLSGLVGAVAARIF